jgi:hypothetical protein
MVTRALLRFALLALWAGCKSGNKSEERGATVAAAAAALPAPPPADAGAVPARAQAAETLSKFSERLLANDVAGAREHLRIPEGYSEKQIEYFLQEIRAPEYLSAEGVKAVLEADFGLLEERFGEEAEGVAESLGLPLESVYAFGDSKAAALLLWDGKAFQVAALHRLSKPR